MFSIICFSVYQIFLPHYQQYNKALKDHTFYFPKIRRIRNETRRMIKIIPINVNPKTIGIQNGDKTHNQDQVITPHSFSVIKIIPKTVESPIPPLDFSIILTGVSEHF